MINDLWYKNAVIYCLSVGTYMDANGDGTGDFQGLMRRLDSRRDRFYVVDLCPLISSSITSTSMRSTSPSFVISSFLRHSSFVLRHFHSSDL